MNIVKFTSNDGKKVLINFDNVTEIQPLTSGGCEIYFNTMVTESDQSYAPVKESLEEIELMVNRKS